MSETDKNVLLIGDELLAERRGGPEARLPDDMHPLAARTIHAIDWLNDWTGRIVCLMVVPIIFAMVYEVVARKFFVAPTLWSYDVSRMLYGMSFMLGAGYALMRGLHIRADFIYRGFSERIQGRIDLILYVVLFMPSMLLLLYAGYEFALKSILQGERAGDSTWAPIVWPVKSSFAIGVALLALQGISEILKSWYAATRGKWPV
ncbi:TRAP-type mannitol/chloroaromatic compound transport system permease small subunit [Hoeflea marina]|uniref:TRAP transporter small permease protein n=1 Tax=Hoeflea marina TaxID=274592 RepID=A0A317PI32_9HYPH|nr:TRAP transporter small permease subunit [Hoeflea marina]PWW00004.1 TRAP-type mannitol/chloroaromatic compound transport system permease small subunit [Hoeflea marina]